VVVPQSTSLTKLKTKNSARHISIRHALLWYLYIWFWNSKFRDLHIPKPNCSMGKSYFPIAQRNKKTNQNNTFSNTSFFDAANLKHAYIQMHDKYSLSSPNHGTKFCNSRSLSHNLFTLSHAPNLHDWLPLSLSLISTKVSFFAIQEINNNGAQELTLSNLNDLVTSFKKSQLVKVGTLI
jgi:hypothetical protein